MCRIELVGGDTTLSQLAERALDATTEIHTATDEDDRPRRGEKARLAIQDFLTGRYRSCPVTDPCTLLAADRTEYRVLRAAVAAQVRRRQL